MVHFRKIGDRNTGQEVRCMKVNPRMDLVALSLSNGDIVLHRLISWQRVWTLPKLKHLRATVLEKTEDGKEHSKITDFTWSPSGRILAVLYEGYFEKDSQSYPANILNHFRSVPSNDASGASGAVAAGASSGSISAMALFDIDANKLVASLNSDLPLRCLFWGELDPSVGQDSGSTLPLDTLDIPYLDLFGEEDDFHQFLGPLAASKVAALGYGPLGGSKGGQPGLKKGQSGKSYHSKNSSLEDYEKVALFGPSPDSVPFNILLTGSSEGAIDVYAYGLYRLLRIDLTLIFTSPRLPSSASLRQLWISNDLSLAKVFLEASNKSQLFSLPFPLLATKWRQLVAYIRLKAALDIRLEYLYDTLKEIASIWEDLMAEIDSKLSNYVNRDEESPGDANENPFKPRSNKIRLTPNEFIEMLVFGEISLNLERFLTDLTDKGLKKLASTIEVSFLEIHKANINKVQRALFHILSLLGILKAMSLHDSAFGDLCLSTVLINGFIRETSAMLQKTVQLQCNLNDSMRKTKAFVRWLHKCTFMVPNAEPNSSPSIGGGAGGNSTVGANSGASGAEAADSMLATGYVLTNQDLNLIMNFLRENSLTNGFKFENIAAFLRKGKGGGMAQPATATTGPSLASTSSSSSSAAFTNLKVSATKKKSGSVPKSRASSSRGQSKGNLGSRAKASTSTTTTTPSGTSTSTKAKLNGSKKPTDSQVPTVPYQEYLSERRFAHFLATLDSLDETSSHLSPNELLSLFFPNILNEDVPGSSPGDLGELEDPWESDLFNEADDLDVLEESAYSHLSLYEHLHQLYARFEGIFAPGGTAASQMNGHCLQAMARQVGVNAQKDLIENIGEKER